MFNQNIFREVCSMNDADVVISKTFRCVRLSFGTQILENKPGV